MRYWSGRGGLAPVILRIADSTVSAYDFCMLAGYSGKHYRRTQVALVVSLLLLVSTITVRGQQSKGGISLPPTAKAAWAAAQRAQQQKNYAIAVQQYLKVIGLAPGFAEAYLNLGLIYDLQNRRPDAIAMFEKAVELKPDLAGGSTFWAWITASRETQRAPYPTWRLPFAPGRIFPMAGRCWPQRIR